MLKFFFMLMFMTPFCFKKNVFWVLQNFLFFFFFSFFFTQFFSFYSNFSYYFSMDLISYGLTILSIWICTLMIMSSEMVFKKNNFEYYFLFLIFFLLFMLLLTFCVVNLFMFYLFFEGSLIPIFFLILGWGYQPERLQAGIYLLFYTLLASLPLLVSIFYLLNWNFSLYFFILSTVNKDLYSLFYLSMVFAFLVKMPMFLVHLWLPKAHVEAPVAGSMILAGILLKLGGYGLLRVFPFLMKLCMSFNYLWSSISLLGGCLISLVCLRQMDMKSLIAYSSVAHMSIVLSGLMTLTNWGLMGSYSLMIAHGLCSSGLFCLANISYERLGSRSLMINKGMLNFLPSLSLWWFLLCSGNMAAPPTLNLLGEISLFNSIIYWSFYSMIFLSFMSFFGAAYSLYLFSFSQQGKIYSAVFSFSTNFVREYFVLLLHWLPLNFLILKSDMCFSWI